MRYGHLLKYFLPYTKEQTFSAKIVTKIGCFLTKNGSKKYILRMLVLTSDNNKAHNAYVRRNNSLGSFSYKRAYMTFRSERTCSES